MATTALIAIDWGTTSARAYRLDTAGHVVGERSAALGIGAIRDGAFAAAQASILGDWASDPVPRLACGMIGSRQGWVEAPYCDCPVELDALARTLTRAPDGVLMIVAGVTCRDAAGVPDVMRGEETQILGAADDFTSSTRSLVVLPGTHSKWAIVTGSRIESFATFMTGELFAVLRGHSILGRMMVDVGTLGAARLPAKRERALLRAAERRAGDDDPAAPGSGAFTRGVERGLDCGSTGAPLLHDIFGARTLVLGGEMEPDESADYLSGLLIGNEIREGRAWAMGRAAADARIVLIGAAALCERYASAFAIAGLRTVSGDANAAAHGLWRLAQQAGLTAKRRPVAR